MKSNFYQNQRGQIVVILAIAIVALLGITALAIDVGMVYSDRRNDQNGSDASSLAGAQSAAISMENSRIGTGSSQTTVNYDNFICTLPASPTSEQQEVVTAVNAARNAAIVAAQARGLDNDFTLGNTLDSQMGVTATCGIIHHDSYDEKYIDIKTMVSSNPVTSFVHLFYGGTVRNTVESVVRIHPRASLGFGNAIVGLRTDCGANDGAVQFGGNDVVNIKGGGVYSAGCTIFNGGVDVVMSGRNPGDPQPPISYYDEYRITGGSSTISPTPTHVNDQLPIQVAPEPDCSSYAGQPGTKLKLNNAGDNVTIDPGVYESIAMTGGKLVFEPGLYCFTGEVKITGGAVYGPSALEANPSANDIADGVTIYMKNGAMEISTNDTVALKAPGTLVYDPTEHYVPGMLIQMGATNYSEIKLRGGTTTYFTGTIYAPRGTIDVGGNPGMHPTFSTQLIGYNVIVQGNSNINFNYDTSKVYLVPTALSMYK